MTERTRTIIEAVGLLLVVGAIVAAAVLLLTPIWAAVLFTVSLGMIFIGVSQAAKGGDSK